MIKTQVQIPDELYRDAKRIAKEREWSLAEVMRRGLEYMSKAYPAGVLSPDEATLPVLHDVSFVANFDEIDFAVLSRDEESMRGFAND
jgi:hypothetical protein